MGGFDSGTRLWTSAGLDESQRGPVRPNHFEVASAVKRFVSFSLAVFIFFCVMIAAEGRAYGYVDPGSGLMALQGAATAAAAFAYFLRRRIRLLFLRAGDERKEGGSIPVKEGKSAKAV
jgi:hypothetical protein